MTPPSVTTDDGAAAEADAGYSDAFGGDAGAKLRYVRGMFGRIAPGYDRMNNLMTAGRHHAWKRLAARLADPAAGLPALDVCCGTGDQAFELAKLGRGPVYAVDFAAPMLRIARDRAAANPARTGLAFNEADALELPFADARFSAATTSFALRNVTDIRRFLSEMRRVVVPGGRVVTLDMIGAPRGPLAPIGRFYMNRVVPLVGRILSGDADAYAYLPQSTDFVPSAEGIAQLMRKAGLEDVSHRSLALGSVAIHVGRRPL